MSITKTNDKVQILQGIHATNDYERSLFGAVKEQFNDNLYRWFSEVRPDHYNSNFFTPISKLTRQDVLAAVAFQKQRGINEVMFSTNYPVDLSIMDVKRETMQKARNGLLSFRSNSLAAIADVILIISAVATILTFILTKGTGYLCYVCLSALVFSFCMHCILNGRIYIFVKNQSKVRQVLEQKKANTINKGEGKNENR